jgi:Ca2+-binding RTX toxin-like protein
MIVAAGTIVMLTLPSPAVADSTCSYDAGSRTVTVDVSVGSNFMTVIHVQGSSIFVGTQNCGGTVTTTDTVVINKVTTEFVDVRVDPSTFVPGFTDEPGSSDEIEFIVNFGPGDDEFEAFVADTTTGSQSYVAGGSQINFNAAETDGIDADITLNQVDRVFLGGGSGPDSIVGTGGVGTPPVAFAHKLLVYGGGGSDLIVGGQRSDGLLGMGTFQGGPDGDDTIRGGSGRDSVDGDEGNDLLHGSGGRDSLLGDVGSDLIRGGAGRDVLAGHAGNDQLNGGADEDVCGGGPGKDKLKSCEIVKK